MREIKFRGKRTDNGEWVYGYYFFQDGMHYIVPVYGEFVPVHPPTVGQYIGREDKYRNKIYEGDIVNVESGYSGDHYVKEHVSVVEWDYDGWYASDMTDYKWKGVEIFGNRYDNPNILLAKNA